MNTKDLEKYSFIQPLNLVSSKEIHQYYTCDVLSWVLGHVQEKNTCLLTMQTQLSVLAVAKRLSLSCIIFCEVIPNEQVIQKATEEDIIIFQSSYPSAKTLMKLIQNQYE